MADRSMVKTAPTSEKGSATGIPLLTLATWATLGGFASQDLEYVPELQWPNSTFTYQRMRNDSQVDGLSRGAVLPLSRWGWALDGNSADPAIIREGSRDFGLPIAERNGASWRILESPIPRQQGRFNFSEHRTEALLALLYGHSAFEQVTDLVKPPDDWPINTPLRARFRKLAFRPPWTITEINTERDGGLKSIKQLDTPINDPGLLAEQIVMYVWGKEGANWTGRSMLRSCYRPWLIKDRLMRVGAINIERNGAGVPIVSAPPGATKAQIEALDNLARRIRGGDSSGGAIPNGAVLQLMGVIGSQPDAVGFMKFLNEEMSRAFLQMFQLLGQTETGSRALGATMLDYFTWVLEAIADWYCEVFNTYVIEDWMAWNVGTPDDPNVDSFAPRLIYIPAGQATDGLAEAAESGAIQVDDETKQTLQEPDKGSTTASRRTPGGHGGRLPASAERRAASPEATLPASLPARQLRRAPYDHELAAATDFAAIDSAYNSALDLLQLEVRQLIRIETDQLHDAIVEAGADLEALSEISAEPLAGDVIASRLSQVADLAAGEAVMEAARQGTSIDRPDLADFHASLATRSNVLDAVIARDVTEAAVRRAVRLTGGALDAVAVADQVRNELNAMTWTGVRDTLGGAIQGAQNGARGMVFRRDETPGDIYASELLDTNTCSACMSRDGTHYADMNAAEQDYPFGGYKDCDGGSRCRGTLVKVYES